MSQTLQSQRLQMSPPSLSIIIPCYNEEAVVSEVLSCLCENMKLACLTKVISSVQIIVVDDASVDGTAKALAAWPQVEVIRMGSRSGYGAALKAGFWAARGEMIGFLDMDRTYHPSELLHFLNSMRETGADLVLGDRLLTREGMPRVRRIGNLFFSFLARVLHGCQIRDVCTGYRVFRRALLKDVCAIKENGLNFSLAMTIWAVQSGHLIKEIPISYQKRIGSSKLSVSSDGLRFLITLLSRILWRFSLNSQ